MKNTSQGVILEVEGDRQALEHFEAHVINHPPPLSLIEHFETEALELEGSEIFEIHSSESTDTGEGDLLVSPDIAICDNCRREMWDPNDRRYRYPFINCTDCGPRFSIIRELPYDRPKTTMAIFDMCPPCRKEYEDPFDRRYHAQPISCYDCGPTLTLYDKNKNALKNPMETAGQKLAEGFVVAVKGLGGYHLACIATEDEPVTRLRQLKKRENKPFALMGTYEMICRYAEVSEAEKKILHTPASPILLLKSKHTGGISTAVVPDQKDLGFMLPYTPLHLLLLDYVKAPLVMTSANISDEPIIYKDNIDAILELSDFVLTNNRDIHMFADDSVARVWKNRLYMIRRSRGFIPMPLKIPAPSTKTILALGPMLKTTFTFLFKDKAIMSQYIGDTDSPASIEAERFAIDHFKKVFALEPEIIVVDKHPGYPNRQLTELFKGAEMMEIQHHEAHIGALLAENGEREKILGISIDGTGYGDDGKIWGGEFFVGDYRGLTRFGHLGYLFLPSGDKAAKEPWRFALSILYSLYGENEKTLAFARRYGAKGEFLLEAIKKKLSGILTSSGGRVFDAVSVLLGLGDVNDYEGELPIRLQACAEKARSIKALSPVIYTLIQSLPKQRKKVITKKRSAFLTCFLFSPPSSRTGGRKRNGLIFSIALLPPLSWKWRNWLSKNMESQKSV